MPSWHCQEDRSTAREWFLPKREIVWSVELTIVCSSLSFSSFLPTQRHGSQIRLGREFGSDTSATSLSWVQSSRPPHSIRWFMSRRKFTPSLSLLPLSFFALPPLSFLPSDGLFTSPLSIYFIQFLFPTPSCLSLSSNKNEVREESRRARELQVRPLCVLPPSDLPLSHPDEG